MLELYLHILIFFAAEWVSLLSPIEEITGSNLGPITGYSDDRVFLVIFSSIPLKYRGSASSQAATATASFRILSDSLFINHPIIRRNIITVIQSVVE
jgi:hypothetical protein